MTKGENKLSDKETAKNTSILIIVMSSIDIYYKPDAHSSDVTLMGTLQILLKLGMQLFSFCLSKSYFGHVVVTVH